MEVEVGFGGLSDWPVEERWSLLPYTFGNNDFRDI